MATQIKIFCDCCGQEIERRTYSNKYKIEELVYSGPNSDSYISGSKYFDICDECAEAFDTAIQGVFDSNNTEGEQENEP